MDFLESINIIKKYLEKTQPKIFNSVWIKVELPNVYQYLNTEVINEVGDIDWDQVISKLDRTFQRRWLGEYFVSQRKRKKLPSYKGKSELNIILKKYQNKLYTFLATVDKEDEYIRDVISVTLVRLSQKGNVLAKKELLKLCGYIIQEWIVSSPRLYRWKEYTPEAMRQLELCINRYRYPGTFTGYLFRTLECRGRGLPPTYSLDDHLPNSDRKRLDTVVQDQKTHEIYCFKS